MPRINLTGGGGGVIESQQELQLAPIPTTSLSDGEFISFRLNIPAGYTLKIWAVGVQNVSNNAPAGLTAEVDNESTSTNLVSRNAKRSTGEPLAEVSVSLGSIDIAFRVENDTGGDQNASATFAYTIEAD